MIESKQKKRIFIVKYVFLVLLFVLALLLVEEHQIKERLIKTEEKEHQNAEILLVQPISNIQEEIHAHSWTDADCETPKTCFDCGKFVGKILGHNFTEATYKEASYCLHCEATIGEPTSNYFFGFETRYNNFHKKHQDLPIEVIVHLVNANVDIEGYSDPKEVTDPYDYLVLMNKNFVLPSNFRPSDLRNLNGGRGRLREAAANAYNEMRDEAREEGLSFIVMSSYRSFYTQRRIFNNSVSRAGLARALMQIARPGHSEHQTGLAVDILHRSNVSTLRSANFQDTEEFEWLTQNAHRFGFILRYPEGMEDLHGYIFEPWHWRYVGEEVATFMFEQGITTFEEYHGMHRDFGLEPHDQISLQQ